MSCDGTPVPIFTHKISSPVGLLTLNLSVTVENDGDGPITLLVGPANSVDIPSGMTVSLNGNLSRGETVAVRSAGLRKKVCKVGWRVDMV
jgi:hypothetical protein